MANTDDVGSYTSKFGKYDQSADLREVSAEPNSITFKEQRRIHPMYWFAIACVCLVAFLIALLCFYVVPSKREVHVKANFILNEVYRDTTYGDNTSPEYKYLDKMTIESFSTVLTEYGIQYKSIDLADPNPRRKLGPHAIRHDPLGLLVTVNIVIIVDTTPVRAPKQSADVERMLHAALLTDLPFTVLGSLGVHHFWIASSTVPEATLECDDMVVSTDIGLSTTTLNVPQPDVKKINGETPLAHRLPPNDYVKMFPLGKTELRYRVIYTAFANGGAMAECSFHVTVQDTESPVILCPQDFTTTNPVKWPALTIVDNVSERDDITVEASHGSGSQFRIGNTMVFIRVMDEAGNKASCAFNITV